MWKPEMTLTQCEIFGPGVERIESARSRRRDQNCQRYRLRADGRILLTQPGHIERIKPNSLPGTFTSIAPAPGPWLVVIPLAGFKMSGGGHQAGGSDYLLNFLVPAVVTKTSMRHGFAPEATPERRANFSGLRAGLRPRARDRLLTRSVMTDSTSALND
jgi:hypothetical protein